MYSLSTKIERLPGVGPSLKRTLNNLGLFYIEDLLYHLPFRYIDFSKKTSIINAQVGQLVTIQGTILSVTARKSFRSRLQFTDAVLEDDSGEIKLMFFNQPYLASQLSVGDKLVVAGKIEWYKDKQLTNPFFEKIEEDHDVSGKILPIYHLTKGLTNLRVVKFIKLAWENTVIDPVEFLSKQIIKRFKLIGIRDALYALHFPSDSRIIEKARSRIAIDDCLPQQMASAIKQKSLENSLAPVIPTDIEFIKEQLALLPFELTASQKRATWDILLTLNSGKPQSRLLEGDVGSGKTIIALLVSLMTAKAGFQVIILAPTEILAKQHFETFQKFAGNFSNKISLLTRSFAEVGNSKSSKQEVANKLESQDIQIAIGTHALLSEHLKIPRLGLVIIDEQHRFGVAQRAFLQKQHTNDLIPHLLSMSATPIPRSLALSLFGNLEISQLTQMPKNRQKISSNLLEESNRHIAYKKITDEVNQGRQAFVITPKVEESDTDVKSVKAEFERLQKLFPKFKLGLVYGSMSGVDKEAVMTDFGEGKLDILVATTVIEIGIDVPNATVMLIEGAENFGLAQLHQLRGRIGRGNFESFCYLFTTQDDQLETSRLKIFEQTSDGFILAEHDLKERGFGDLFGKQQSGFAFRFPDFITIAALKQAREIALHILETDPELVSHSTLKQQSTKYLETIHTE